MASLPSLMPRLPSGSGTHLDRVPWRVGACVSAFGWRVGVRSNRPDLLPGLVQRLPPGWRRLAGAEVDEIFSLWVGPPGQAGTPGVSHVYAGGRRCLRSRDLVLALDVLESELRQGVASRARGRVFVHAGVVGWRGRAIVIPGRSRSGKTTLVAELLRHGAEYLSDEFAVLDSRGRVHPFAKPLSVRGPGGCDRHASRPRAEDLGSRSATRSLPVGLVALASYREGAAYEARPLSPGEAVLEMLAHTVPARLRPGSALDALSLAASKAVLLRVERGEAAPAAGRLVEALERSVTRDRRVAS